MMGLVDWMINFKKSHGMADTSVNMPQEMKDLLKTYAGISIVTDSCEMLGENRNYVDFAFSNIFILSLAIPISLCVKVITSGNSNNCESFDLSL